MKKNYLQGLVTLIFAMLISSGIAANGRRNDPPLAGLQLNANNVRYTVDFDNSFANVNNAQYTGSGFTTTPASGQLNSNAWAITGWSDGNLAFGATNTSGDYARGVSTGAVNTGGMYAFEINAGNRTMGFQPGGLDWAPGTATLRLQNNTGSMLIELEVDYRVYIRNDQGRSNAFNFSYSTDNSVYTTIPAVDLISGEIADPVLSWVSNTRSTTITGLSIPVGGYVYLRWSGTDVSGSGSRDEFALDDIELLANPNMIPTPVLLLNFSGLRRGNINKLHWSTLTEINNRGFQVQRSSDGLNYESIGFVNSLALDGNSQLELQYSFTDNDPAGRHWYRLLQIDFDGRQKESPVIFIASEEIKSVLSVSVFPNPVSAQLNLLLKSPKSYTLLLRVFDAAGKLVLSTSVKADEGSKTINLDVSKLLNGVYGIGLFSESGSRITSTTFIKRN